MIKCSKCGSELKDYVKFCNNCGAKVSQITPESTAHFDILRKRIEKDSLNPKLYVEMGLMYLQNNFLQEALIEFQKAVSIDNSEYEAHLRSGEIYLDLEDIDKAESSYQKALNLNPTSPEVKLGLFRVCHLRRKAEEGIRLGEELIQADPNNLEVHKALKEMYNEKGMREEAFRELLTITALAPNDKESLEELAEFYGEREDNENEIKCYQKILELDPKDVVSRFNLGKSFCLKGDFQKAIEYLRNSVTKMAHPFESYGHLYLALSYAGQQDFDNAIQEIGLTSPLDYEELTDGDKKLLADTHFKIGCGILQRRLFYSAIDHLQKAIKYDPQNTEYQKQLETTRAELKSSKRKARKKTLGITIGFLAVAIIVVVGWYLSHGKIQLHITPAESVKPYLDGKPLEEGSALKAGLITSPSLFFGIHKITIEKDGYEKWEKDVKVGFGITVSVEAKLVPIYGSLQVNSRPPGAEVNLDGKTIGKTPYFSEQIQVGDCKLEILKSGYVPFSTHITIQKKEISDLGNVLLREYAHVQVNSFPTNAAVLIDGVSHKRTPLNVDILPGDHELLVNKDYYRPTKVKIGLTNGEKKNISISLPQFEGVWEGKWKPGVDEVEYLTLEAQQEKDKLTIKCDGLMHYCSINKGIDFGKLKDDTLVFWHPIIGKVLITKDASYGFEIKWSKKVDEWPLEKQDNHDLVCFITQDAKHMVGIELERYWREGGEPVYFDLKDEKTSLAKTTLNQEPTSTERKPESEERIFSKIVEIPANQQWIDASQYIEKGQRLVIHVTGKINHGCPDCGASPNGGSRMCGQYHCGAVVGKIAVDGETFFVGENFDGTASHNGSLFLGVVDTRYGDNRGAFTATISVK
jgi:tetratricopeptide (TPR) repeat protein